MRIKHLTWIAVSLIVLGANAIAHGQAGSRPHSRTAQPEDEIRRVFERFVAAQNDHNSRAVEELLLDSPQFLWITRGIPVWGRAAAIKRFESLFAGTWRLDPDMREFKVVLRDSRVAQIFVPIVFTIGPPGQAAQDARFLMNQVLTRSDSGWRISSILPIPVAGAPK